MQRSRRASHPGRNLQFVNRFFPPIEVLHRLPLLTASTLQNRKEAANGTQERRRGLQEPCNDFPRMQ